MKISIRLASLLEHVRNRRGLIAEIEKYTGIERHTITGLLSNTVKYVSLDALAKISDYLIAVHGVDPAILPGALLGRDPEHFWEMLSSCGQVEFCIGARVSPDWPGAEYVMSTDSRLQGMLLSKLSQWEIQQMHAAGASAEPGAEQSGSSKPPGPAPRGGPAEPDSQGRAGPFRRQHPRFHLITAPERHIRPDNPGPQWAEIVARARAVYENGPATASTATSWPWQSAAGQGRALVALGSVKVNPVVELILAHAFRAEPFASLDHLPKASQRPCPLLFRYRDDDPQPPSFCGGVQIAADTPAPWPGIYYETQPGQWACCPWDAETHDAAFLMFAMYPARRRVEVACGGFSSRATHCLTDKLDEIISALGEPLFSTPQLTLGMYVIEFRFATPPTAKDPEPAEYRVLPIPREVLSHRLAHWK
jgi:hypothetical protein